MRNRHEEERVDRRRERGAVTVIVVFALGAMFLFAALALDVGFVWASRTQTQNVADAAALAAAMDMHSDDFCDVKYAAARAEAINYGLANSTVANTSVAILASNIDFGTWDAVNENLIVHTPPTTVASELTGVQVKVVQDGTSNQRSPTILGRLAGFNGFDVVASATAYVGFEGTFDPQEFELPIVVDSCAISTAPSGCTGPSFCGPGGVVPSPCPSQPGLSCLDLAPPSPGVPKDFCFSGFKQNPVSTQDLIDIVNGSGGNRPGNPAQIVAGAQVYLDDGTNAVVGSLDAVQTILDAFTVQATDSNGDGIPEWVVKLPTVECQDTANCGGGQAYAINGGVCFEVRAVLPAPISQIQGRFLCPCDPLYAQCIDGANTDPPSPNAPGGCDFGLLAERPVLVQ